MQQALLFDFKITNNEAEYEALLVGMQLAKALEVKHLQAHSDSLLVVRQFSGEYETQDPKMAECAAKVRVESSSLDTFVLNSVKRTKNVLPDALSRLAIADLKELDGSVSLETFLHPSLVANIVMPIDPVDDWTTPLYKYLADEILPTDLLEAK